MTVEELFDPTRYIYLKFSKHQWRTIATVAFFGMIFKVTSKHLSYVMRKKLPLECVVSVASKQGEAWIQFQARVSVAPACLIKVILAAN